MKLRINGNSLRLRLLRSEVVRLLAGDRLEETIHFTPEAAARFSYTLQLEPEVSMPTIQYSGNRVAVLIPDDVAIAWGTSDQVGIAEDINLGEFGALALLIEKDFACLDHSQEDNQDTFANPNAAKTC